MVDYDLNLLSFHNLRNSQWTLSLIYDDRWLKLCQWPEKAGYTVANMRFGEEGSMFTLINLIPNNHIRQNPLTVHLMRVIIVVLRCYNYLTQAYSTTVDKSMFLKYQSPEMYNQISDGKPIQVFESYNKIKDFL